MERQELEIFGEIGLTVGVGKNRFTMKRGSFRYRQRFGKKRSLRLSGREEGPDGLRLRYEGADGTRAALLLREEDGRTVLSLELPEGAPWNRFWLTFPADPAEHVYGCGEVYSTLDLKGERVRIWVAEHQNAALIAGKLLREKLRGPRPEAKLAFERYETYYAQPTFLSSKGYFVHVDSGSYMEFDFRQGSRTTLLLRGNGDVYFGRAEDMEALSMGLAGLLGKQPALPEYLLDGVILASQRGTDSLEQKLRIARDHGIPVTGFWCQDWCGCRETEFGYQVMWNWQYDETLYPDLPERIQAWRDQGIRFFGYINPFLATEGDLYREASERGYCVRNRAGEDYMVTITTFPAAMIDLTNPDAWDWYKGIIRKNLIGIGMAGWMADFGEYLPTDAVLFSGEDPAEKHNRWPALWARLNREAIDESGKELFFFVRAGYTGTIRNAPMVWNGDQHVDWSKDLGIGSVIPASLSLGLGGVGLCHSDIGGYTSILHMKRSRELLMRWTELACFSPLMRMHEGNRPGENIQFDGEPALLDHLARMGRLHASLGGYLRETMAEYYRLGLPMMRPVWYYDRDPALLAVDDEYLLGRDLLVAPVLEEGAVSRKVLLPEGRWVHLFTGAVCGGGAVLAEAPLGEPPVFLKEGSAWADKLLQGIRELD